MNPKRSLAMLFGIILSATTGSLIPRLSQAAAVSGATPPVRIATKTLAATGIKAAPQQSKPITIATATLTARGAAALAPTKPMHVKTATLVAKGKRSK